MKTGSKFLLVSLPVIAGTVAVMSVISIASNDRGSARTGSNSTQPLPVRFDATCGSANRIGAVGLVEPVGGIVKVGSQASGIVREVFVTPGTVVRKGDPLLRLDDRSASAQLELRRSELELARANMAAKRARALELREDVRAVRAALEGKRAELAEAEYLATMAERLKTASVLTMREQKRRQFLLLRSAAAVRQAEARLAKAHARLAMIDREGGGSAIAVEIAEVAKAQTLVRAAEINMELLTVRAPEDGMLLQLNVRPGELATPDSEPLVLMGNRFELQVRVDIDETDVARFQPDQPARALRRGEGSDGLALTLARVEPIVVPKQQLADRMGERIDSRVLQVVYRLQDARLVPGELVDVFFGEECAAKGDALAKVIIK